MKKIAIISSSVRDGRLSHRVALFLKKHIAGKTGMQTDLIDLKEYGFPLFNERLSMMPAPEAKLVDYARRVSEADGIMIVTPVYNGSFPASLKNAIDVLYVEWDHKPVSIVSVTYGNVPGIATVQSLQALLLKMGARVAGPLYTVTKAGEEFAEDGTPADPATAVKRADPAVNELAWLIEKSSE